MILFEKYMQNLLFETRDANFIFLGAVSRLKALIYSICGISWIVLKIIAWSFLGNDSFAVVSAKVLCEVVCGWLDVERGGRLLS